MTTTYTHILDLAREAEPPADGILSRTVFQDQRIKAVVFGFGQGQELSEHTAAEPAMLYFVKGEASVGLGDDVQEAQAGTLVHMPANLKHSIKAKTPVVMLLVLLKCGEVMNIITVKIEKPDDTNFILGQTHFIKSVEDIHEALVGAVPGIKFGLAFCEASGKCLVRWSGTDPAVTELAKKNAADIGAGHTFIVFLGDGFFPLNVLNTLKMVPEVCRLFCATANPTEVILTETETGRGILGVVDGFSPKGVEDEGEIRWRKDFLRKIGYKL